MASALVAKNRALQGRGPEVTFVPENKHVVPKPGQSLLEIAEANGLPIEAGCRMGICGADPVAIKDGMECTSAISDDERPTLERLGLALEHADGVLRARPGPGDGRADARQGRGAEHQPGRGLQLRPRRRAASS